MIHDRHCARVESLRSAKVFTNPFGQRDRLRVGRLNGRGAARAEDAQGTPTQSYISPCRPVYEEKLLHDWVLLEIVKRLCCKFRASVRVRDPLCDPAAPLPTGNRGVLLELPQTRERILVEFIDVGP